MATTIAEVIRAHFPAYAQARRVPLHWHRAAWLLSRCGRSELGGHVERCACAQTERVVWHSCKHRLCPRCARKGRNDWLDDEATRLLPCAHHHIVFTLPHELLDWWRFNRAAMADALFAAAAATLTELLADPRYLGATPGLLLALHTWSRSLALHPHVHALVTDGGFAGEQWRTPRRSHFLPARVVKALFRGKLLAALTALLAAERLRLPPDWSVERARSLINRLGRAKWHVWLCARYAHGHGVLTYLARYLRGGPVRDAQLARAGAHIVTHYRAHGAPPARLVLAPDAWLARYLEHVPPTGQHTLRRYGLYASAAHARRERARAQVAPCVPRPVRRVRVRLPRPVPCCTRCSEPLRFAYRLPPQRSPP